VDSIRYNETGVNHPIMNDTPFPSSPCPLCGHAPIRAFHRDRFRAYLRCPVCGLIFVPPEDRLPPEEEKARYDLHQNHPDDLGYRDFLNQLARPLLARLGPPPLDGLDYGSGPGPTLSVMLKEHGHRMALYDIFYAVYPEAMARTYDFVTCTETFEHFHNPREEWNRLVGLVRPGGWLAIMTLLIDDPESFPDLHYIADLTHVSFFSCQTFRFLTARDGLPVEFIGNNVILIQKPEGKSNAGA